MNSLSSSRKHFGSIIVFAYSLYVTQIHYESIFFFANLLRIHRLFCEFTMNLLSFSWIDYGYTIFPANSLWIHYLFGEFTMNSLSVLWIHYKFTFFFVIDIKVASRTQFWLIDVHCDLKLDLKLTWLGSNLNYLWFNMHILYIWSLLSFLITEWPFLTLSMTLNDHDIHAISIRIEFGI